MSRKVLVIGIVLISTLLSNQYNLTISQYLEDITKNDPSYKSLFYDVNTLEGIIKSMEAMYDTRLFGGYSQTETG